ncbi:MAG: RsmB/NOP family class I SAM-dependent RNA methyltransferase [Oscillospiraceae bacterium]|nr:RsmB/NOP family class I SAM-dependent RNA methyltransferase [Oscillospiraceae bacterium]
MLPELFCEKMKSLLGEEYDAFLAALDRPRAVGLRLNPLKVCSDPACRDEHRSSADKQCLSLQTHTGVSKPTILNSQFSIFNLSPVPWCPTGFYYDPATRPGLHPCHAAGAYYLQEPSAMAPGELLDPRPGERVLDLCAAPGGKSTQLAGKMAGEGLLVCNEIHPKRAGILASNIERLGIANALVLNEHPARLAERFPAYFDRVLVDAPCSGEGMFRKHDAAFEDWSPETVAMCARRQAEILDCAAAMLRPGGRLVYSTCTFSPEENEGSVAGLLERNPDFAVETVQAPWFSPGRPEWADGNPALAQTLRLWPHRLRGEGHFAAVLRKGDADAENAVGAAAGRRPESPGSRPRHSMPCPEGSRRGSEGSVLPRPAANLLSELGITLPAGKPAVFGERVFWAPPETPELRGLKVLRPGLELAELRGELAVPAHALALWASGAASVHELSADEPACAAYLRGETLPTEARGWTLVRVDGLSLGWGKGVKGVLKNHYPKGLRTLG